MDRLIAKTMGIGWVQSGERESDGEKVELDRSRI